ncbi:MAG: patatin-like phospholipase family protein [Nitrosomonadales bacterium]|nr:patatin-like phospholipase family protein [Nitrosomonadales bacterium]
MKNNILALLLLLGTVACTTTKVAPPVAPPEEKPPVVEQPAVERPPAKIALVLGGGAARGFAHIGVIKALEAQGISPDIVVGTSAGAVVGALYASGLNGFQIQELSMNMKEEQVLDGSGFYQCIFETMISDKRGCIRGQALQVFINNNIRGRTMEKLGKTFAAVAANLKTGELMAFRSGDTGLAVRASSSVPVFFEPVTINGQDYVDGGLVAPVPSSVARTMGADFVIAVDISGRPQDRSTAGIYDILWQTFSIFGKSINRHEQSNADIVIRPAISGLPSTDASGRNKAVLEGEKAVAKILPELKARLEKLNEIRRVPGMP